MKLLVFTFLFFFSYFFKEGEDCFGQDWKEDTSDFNQMSYAEIDSVIALLYAKGNYTKAIPYAEQGYKMAKNQSIFNDSIYSEYLNVLGAIYFQSGKYSEAEPIMIESVSIDKITFGSTSIEYAESLNNLGTLYISIGNYNKAEKLLSKNIEIKLKLNENNPNSSNFNVPQILNNLAILYSNIGLYDKSEKLFLKANQLLKLSDDSTSTMYINNIEGLGFLYEQTMRADKALFLFLELEYTTKKIFGTIHIKHANALVGLAASYMLFKEYHKAEDALLKAKDIQEEININSKAYSLLLGRLGTLYVRLKKYNLSEDFLLRASNLNKKLFGKNNSNYLNSLGNLAFLYIETKRYNKAKNILHYIINIEEKILKKSQLSYIHSINNLADLYFRINKIDSALYYTSKALLLNSPNLVFSLKKENQPVMIDSFSFFLSQKLQSSNFIISKSIKYNNLTELSTSLAIINDALQKKSLSEKNYNTLKSYYNFCKYSVIMNSYIQNKNSYTNRFLISIFNSSFIDKTISTAIELAKIDSNIKQESLMFFEINKSFFLENILKNNKLMTLGYLPDSLSFLEFKFKEDMYKLASRKYRKTNKQDSIRLIVEENNLNLKISLFLQKIETKYTRHNTYKNRNLTTTTKQIQNLISNNSLFLEYYVTDSNVYLLSLTKENIQIHKLNLQKQQLDDKIKLLHQALSDYEFIRNNPKTARQQYTKNAYWFYKQLVEPALKNQKNITQLIIIPDYKLNHLPFEIFLSTPKDTLTKDYKNLHYLVKDYSISYNYSATLLNKISTDSLQYGKNQILAYAGQYTSTDSITNLRNPYLVNRRNRFGKLKSAEKEVTFLKNKFQGLFLKNQKTNENHFKKHSKNYGVIHLAMHGYYDTLNPILSSLIFTEDYDSLENNFLHTYEISRLQLQAKLVVLSACETGYGVFQQGEGVLSLARSFMQAGVPSLIVSLWKVDDVSTSLLVQSFYTYLAEGLPKDEALRLAKLDFFEQEDERLFHPFFWASFIQLGTTQPILLDRKQTNNWFYFFTATLVFIGYFIWRRKKD